MCNHENNFSSRLSLQWLCGNWCTWVHNVRLHIAGNNEPRVLNKQRKGCSLVLRICSSISCVKVNELPQRHCEVSREGTLLSRLHIYYAFMPIMLRQILSTLYVVNHFWILILRSMLCLLNTLGSLVLAMCNRTSSAQMHELPQSRCGDNREGTFFSWLHITLRSSSSGRFSVLCVLWITYDHLYYTPCFACWALFDHWYQ